MSHAAGTPAAGAASPDDTAGVRFADFLHRESKTVERSDAYSATIVPTSIYAQPGDPAGEHQYARWSNPGWTALESALGALEGAQAAVLPSGMAAVVSIFASTLRAGDRLLLQSDGYMGTRVAAEKYFAPYGITVDTCATTQVAGRDFAGYRLILLETPSNPGLDLIDIRDCARRAHAAGALLVIDNTMMTPLGQQPLDLGADAVLYADTKTINGHSDVVFGHVATRNAQLLAGVRDWRRICGAIPGPFETWLVQRGLETLEVRLARMHENALVLAQALVRHGGARSVIYPGLPGHPAHALARAQMRGFGTVISLTLPGKEAAEAFIQGCAYLRAATSFGGLHASAERRARWGDPVEPGFIRLSVGCEPTQALCAEVLRALDQVAPAAG
jgi:cystathionine gamma-lyase